MNYFQLLYDLCSIYDSLENKVVTHKDIIRKIKKTVPFTECKIIGNSSLSLATNSFIVAGLYDCELDEEGKPPIEVEIIFPKRKETFLFTQDDVSKEHWGEFCIDFANILGHEFVHLNQFRRRNFNWSRPYKSINTKPGIKEQQEYYGNSYEIDAYAFMAAAEMAMVSLFNPNQKTTNLQKTDVYKTYTRWFDKKDPVVLKLELLSNRYYKRLKKQYYVTYN
jgi:hypothetical protein